MPALGDGVVRHIADTGYSTQLKVPSWAHILRTLHQQKFLVRTVTVSSLLFTLTPHLLRNLGHCKTYFAKDANEIVPQHSQG